MLKKLVISIFLVFSPLIASKVPSEIDLTMYEGTLLQGITVKSGENDEPVLAEADYDKFNKCFYSGFARYSHETVIIKMTSMQCIDDFGVGFDYKLSNTYLIDAVTNSVNFEAKHKTPSAEAMKIMRDNIEAHRLIGNYAYGDARCLGD
jgi:hypothetical protein